MDDSLHGDAKMILLLMRAVLMGIQWDKVAGLLEIDNISQLCQWDR